MAKRRVSVLEPPEDPETLIENAVHDMSDVEVECRDAHDWPKLWNRRMLDDRIGEQRKKCRRCKVTKRQWVNVITGHIVKTLPYDYSESGDYVKKRTGHHLQTVNGRAAIRRVSWNHQGFEVKPNGRTPTDA